MLAGLSHTRERAVDQLNSISYTFPPIMSEQWHCVVTHLSRVGGAL